MKQFKQSAFLQYVLSGTVLSFCLLTQEHNVSTDGGYSKLYGFPFPYISELWVHTGYNSVFVMNLVVDFALYFCFWTLVFVVLQKKKLLPRNTFIPKFIFILFLWKLLPELLLWENGYSFLAHTDFEVTSSAFHFGFYP